MNNHRVLAAILRQDFSSFINKIFDTINPTTEYQPNWHIELIADYLESVRSGEIKRLIINMPPRALKSVCVSVAWPAWILGHDPSKRIMVSSYSQILSIKHSLDCKLAITSPWYQNIFAQTTLSKKHNQKSKFLTSQNGFRFATSVGGSTTGEGGDFLIVDDPHNPIHIHSAKMRHKAIEWFEQIFLTRLNDKKQGAIVLVMQRLHKDDLAGYLLSSSNNWQSLIIQAKATQNFTFSIKEKQYQFLEGQNLHQLRDNDEDLRKLEQDIGRTNYLAQYLQQPINETYAFLQEEDIGFYDITPNMQFEYFVQSWDTAIKISENADYSVCTCWGIAKDHYYLVAMIRDKLFYPELKKTAKKLAGKYFPRFILIEDKSSGQSLIQDLRLDGFCNIIPIKPKLDKITRFAASVPFFQSKKILIPKQSSFNTKLMQELLYFPHSKNDDIIDSISQFINFIKEKSKNTTARIRSI